ncbi:MAG: PspA/IM30 family protein [Planctomycetales bacterium]
MIFSKLWRAVAAQFNKLANFFWTIDPIAQMQYEYDKAVDQIKEGRKGLEQYRALVERVNRQVDREEKQVAKLEAKVKSYLRAGDRETAAKFAIDMKRAKDELAENLDQLSIHEQAYENNLTKIKHATGKLKDVKNKIAKFDAELKMSRAEAELADLAGEMNFDVTTDFGQIEEVIEERIGLNRAKTRVAADLSTDGLAEIQQEQAMEASMAEDALREYEIEMGLVSASSSPAPEAEKELGPSRQSEETTSEG